MAKRRRLRQARINFKKKMNNLSNSEEKKLKEVETLALDLMKKHGVTNYHFRFGYGWKYLGLCKKYEDDTHGSIIIQYKFALNSDIESIKNVILHEIAHAIVGPEKWHRIEWQEKAKELGVVWHVNYRK